MAKKKESDNFICRNRRASHRYEILEKLECGIVLGGTEVKSIRDRNVSIEEAYCRMDGSELWLIGCHIAGYRHGLTKSHEPFTKRKLLAHKRELEKLRVRVEQKGLTVIPLDMHFNDRGMVKVTIGVVRGKKQADKRQDMKARDHQREMDRATSRRR